MMIGGDPETAADGPMVMGLGTSVDPEFVTRSSVGFGSLEKSVGPERV